jgi:hypothetical protein
VPSSTTNAAAYTGAVNGSYQATLDPDAANPGRVAGTLAYNVETRYSDLNGTKPAAPLKVQLFVAQRDPATALYVRRLLGYVQINVDGTVFYEPDPDGDFIPTEIDNCEYTPNLDQIDADLDGYGAACDCNDQEADEWNPPSEIPNLKFTNKTALTWGQPIDPGSIEVMLFDVMRQPAPLTYTTSYSCLRGSLTVATTTDTQTPPPGGVFNYQVAGKNECVTVQNRPEDLGTSSDGRPRTGVSCP